VLGGKRRRREGIRKRLGRKKYKHIYTTLTTRQIHINVIMEILSKK